MAAKRRTPSSASLAAKALLAKATSKKVSFHVIRIAKEGAKGGGWTEAENRVESYFSRAKDPKPCEVWIEGKLAYRVWPAPDQKPKSKYGN